MDSQSMIGPCKRHTLFTWAKSGAVNPLPIERAEGVYFWTPDGKRFLDSGQTHTSASAIGACTPRA